MDALLAPEWKSAYYDFFLICLSASLASVCATGKQSDGIAAGSQSEKQLLSVINYNLRILARIVKNKVADHRSTYQSYKIINQWSFESTMIT